MTSTSRVVLLLLSLLPGGGTLGGQAATADSALQSRTRAVSSQLRCPVCQGESIQDSPSELSTQMRDLVREQLRAGRSEEEVKQYFVDRYGEWILLQPKARGANLLLYFAPILAIVGGLILIWRAVRRWTGPRAAPDAERSVSEAATERLSR